MSRGTKTVDEVKKMRYWCDKFEKEPAGSIEDLLLSKGTYTISMLSLLFDCLGMAENFISESEIKTKVRCSGCDVRSFSCYFFFVHYIHTCTCIIISCLPFTLLTNFSLFPWASSYNFSGTTHGILSTSLRMCMQAAARLLQ